MSGIVGQNTLDGSGLIKSPAGGGAWTFIKKLTASSSSTLSFVNGSSDVVLDSTYKTYVFTCKDIHAATNAAEFSFQASIDTGSNYNVTQNTMSHRHYHPEDDSSTSHAWVAFDSAQDGSTAFQPLTINQGNAADDASCGILMLYDPSSTTYYKHWDWYGVNAHDTGTPAVLAPQIEGTVRSTSAVDAVQFKFSSGNIDAGDICLYGIST